MTLLRNNIPNLPTADPSSTILWFSAGLHISGQCWSTTRIAYTIADFRLEARWMEEVRLDCIFQSSEYILKLLIALLQTGAMRDGRLGILKPHLAGVSMCSYLRLP
jgi:hypothetical protein